MPYPGSTRLKKDGTPDRRGTTPRSKDHPWFRQPVGQAKFKKPKGFTPLVVKHSDKVST